MQRIDSALLRQQAILNGQWLDADNGASYAVINPANGQTLVIKHSGMGREGASQGIDEYLKLKYLCQGGL